LQPNRSIPSCSVIPELAYPDVSTATAWLCDAFGFTLRLRIANHRAQLTFGTCAIVVTAARAREGGPTTTDHAHAVMVRVDDVDAHCERARAHGAQILSAPTTYPYGERQYSAVDIGGHGWTFSQSVADVDPADWGGELTV
jgi:uncharacterized glyoxalase superfamily protein PhnB